MRYFCDKDISIKKTTEPMETHIPTENFVNI